MPSSTLDHATLPAAGYHVDTIMNTHADLGEATCMENGLPAGVDISHGISGEDVYIWNADDLQLDGIDFDKVDWSNINFDDFDFGFDVLGDVPTATGTVSTEDSAQGGD
jgi:hypothetical protein